MRARFFSPAILLGLLVSSSSVAVADPFKPGINDQIKLGKRAAEQIRKEEKVLPETDPRVIELRRIGNLLVAQIPPAEIKKRPFPYSFDVIDSKETNAFALPGGPVFLYTGLLDQFKTQDAIAGVLGHELVHIRNQHWASAYADNTKRRMGISVLLILLGAGDTAFDVAAVSDALLFGLPYSRKHESESDKVGYDLMTKGGYNPQGMVDVFEILAKAGKQGEEFMNTHPNVSNRIKDIKARIGKDTRSFSAMRDRGL